MSVRELRAPDDAQTEPDAPASSGGGGGGRDIDRRLAALETRVEYLATKEDIQKIKVWVLSGAIGGIVAAVSLSIAILKFFVR